jgi:hypothetical protein
MCFNLKSVDGKRRQVKAITFAGNVISQRLTRTGGLTKTKTTVTCVEIDTLNAGITNDG